MESRCFDPKLIAFVSFGWLVGWCVRVKQWRNRSNWWLRPREILIPASTHKTNATSLHTTAHSTHCTKHYIHSTYSNAQPKVQTTDEQL